ncbi:hypothetical protein [Lachnoclostridium sp. An169]|uniref:hypothetical protein n=1 Tax=Lachnoclostridium sp. An169 TaxID=1965569 RepID=UPI001951D590|nr:hypothetical protein [Lachnoclostridium sp. An169]
MMKQYEYLNSPMKLGNTVLRNRFVVAPMGVGFIYEPDRGDQHKGAGILREKS